MSSQNLSKIIKSQDISVSGSHKIGLNGTSRGSGPAVQANARLIEATDTYAVIEVFCGCGQVSRIRCNFD